MTQSTNPVNSRFDPFPRSAARRVRAKSNGYTIEREAAPANPPEAMFAAKNFQNSVFLLYFGNIDLNVSLKAKLNACVGKYLLLLNFVSFHVINQLILFSGQKHHIILITHTHANSTFSSTHLITFAMFPLQKDPTPCSAETRTKQSMIPLYGGISPLIILGLAS